MADDTQLTHGDVISPFDVWPKGLKSLNLWTIHVALTDHMHNLNALLAQLTELWPACVKHCFIL